MIVNLPFVSDFDAAVKLANKAERQSLNAMAQYKEQKNAKPRF